LEDSVKSELATIKEGIAANVTEAIETLTDLSAVRAARVAPLS
jgi:hypothetical protein